MNRRTLLPFVACSLLVAACSEGQGHDQRTAEPPPSASCKVRPNLVSGCGVWWGAFVSPNPGADDTDATALLQLERQVDRRLAIVHRYHDMSQGKRGIFPDATEQALGTDRLLFLAWAGRVYGGVHYSWREIADGKIDTSVIDPAARRVAAYGRRLFIDFDHEPETPHPGNGSDVDFAAAYRHIHSRFEALGATNVMWVWTVTGFKAHWHRYDALYPGDDVVDWVAWDPYDFAECRATRRQSFEDTIDPFYDWLVDHHPDKPFMLAEYGTVPDPDDPTASARWYADMVPALREHPRIRAVVQFDHRPGGSGGTVCDTRLRPEPVLQAWTEAGHDPYVNPPLPL